MTDTVMDDFARLRDAVDARLALGAIAFTERSGNWTLVRDRATLPFESVRNALLDVYRNAAHFLYTGNMEFSVTKGPWTLKLREEANAQ